MEDPGFVTTPAQLIEDSFVDDFFGDDDYDPSVLDDDGNTTTVVSNDNNHDGFVTIDVDPEFWGLDDDNSTALTENFDDEEENLGKSQKYDKKGKSEKYDKKGNRQSSATTSASQSSDKAIHSKSQKYVKKGKSQKSDKKGNRQSSATTSASQISDLNSDQNERRKRQQYILESREHQRHKRRPQWRRQGD